MTKPGRPPKLPRTPFAERLDALNLSPKDLSLLIPISEQCISMVKFGHNKLSPSLDWMIERVEERVTIFNGTKINFDNWLNLNIDSYDSTEQTMNAFRIYTKGAIDVMRIFYSPEEIQYLEDYAKLCEQNILEGRL